MSNRITEIRARVEAATEGPWESATVLPAQDTGDVRHPESPWRIINGPPQVIDPAMLSCRAFVLPADGDFIAHARADIPYLLDKVAELEADLQSFRSGWGIVEAHDAQKAAEAREQALRVALVRAERKLSAYVGVCSGDTELTNTVIPMVRAALAATEAPDG